MSTASSLLEVRNLTKSFGDVKANDEISINVARGSITCLIGPNGSGKTTLFSAIAGQSPPDSGSIHFDGETLSGRGAAHIARAGLLRTFQEAQVYAGMTCMDNMRASVAQAGMRLTDAFTRAPHEFDDRATQLLDLMDLIDKQHALANELSFGQLKLLEFGMALMGTPKMLLLDEPTAGVHPHLIGKMIDRIKLANTRYGVTLLVIEHNMGVVMEIAEHVICLANGKVLAEGSPREISADPCVIEAYLGTRA